MVPSSIKLLKKSGKLQLQFGADQFELEAELLRVYSPSAEVRGHGNSDATLQTGKQFVGIEDIQPAGNYGLHIRFDDGHDSGIYQWDYLHELCLYKQQKFDEYLHKLQEAGASRDPDTQVIEIKPIN